MADTVRIILEYLQKNHYAKAAAALREELSARRSQSGSPISPRPDASDMDVLLYLQLSQEKQAAAAAESPRLSLAVDLGAGRAGEDSNIGAGITSGSPRELFFGTASGNGHASPNKSDEAADSKDEVSFEGTPRKESAVEAQKGSRPAGPPIVTHLPPSLAPWSNGIAATQSPTLDLPDGLSAPPQAADGSSRTEEAVLLERDSTLRLERTPEADFPRLPPVRLRSIDRNLDSAKTLDGPALGLDARHSSGENLAGRLAEESAATSGSEAAGTISLAGDGEGFTGKASAGAAPAAGSERMPGTIALGPVVLGSGVGQTVSPETLGSRRARRSVSHGIVEADDASSELLSGVSVEGEAGTGGGTEATSDFPENDWDSDTYDDDDDVGYIRQPIEDEEWFLANEIDYPSDDERGRLRPVEIEQRQVAKPESSPDPAAPDDEVYFSGEEYYQGQVERRRSDSTLSEEVGTGGGDDGSSLDGGSHTRNHRRRSQGGSAWEGLLAKVSQHRNREEDELDGEEEEEDHILDGARSVGARSIGVTGSDVAEAGSSMRESLIGGSSEGDVDSTKGGGASSLLGRSQATQEGTGEGSENECGDEDSGEGDAVEERGEISGSKEREERGGGVEEESREPDGGGLYYTNVWRQKLASKEGAREMPREQQGGPGGFGGFSFPSPSSGGGLSRMDSGRSMWSVGEQTPERSLNEDGDEGGSGVVSGPDDTLAIWKRKSGGSSPVLSPRHLAHQESASPDASGSHSREEEAVVGARLEEAGREVGKLVIAEQDESAAAESVAKAAAENGGVTLAKMSTAAIMEGTEIDSSSPKVALDLRGESSGSGDMTPIEVEEFVVIEPEVSDAFVEGVPPGTNKATHREEEVKEVVEEKIKTEDAGKAVEKEMVDQVTVVGEDEGGVGEVAGAEKVEESPAEEATPEADAQPNRRPRYRPDEDEFETFNLKIVHRKNRTGFEEEKDFPVVINSVIAGRYHVTEYLGSAAFSKAIQAHDLQTGMDVCMKIIKNNKDFFDQSLDEVKLLKYINKNDPQDKHHILRLYDYFYHREHLFIVCELLRANLYEFHKYNRESGGEVYFTLPRLQSISRQCLEALRFMHSLSLIHCDLKPENILVKSYSRCEVKVIDLGSSCFETDHLCSYVQSRSYRAPEVILGLPYGQKIDLWSLGCILAELCSGQVLFQNDSLATLLARVVGILGPIDPELLAKGRDTHKYFTKNHVLYERNAETEQVEYLISKKTSLKHRLPMGDPGFIDFVGHLLTVGPDKRPTAEEALRHPWLAYNYDCASS